MIGVTAAPRKHVTSGEDRQVENNHPEKPMVAVSTSHESGQHKHFSSCHDGQEKLTRAPRLLTIAPQLALSEAMAILLLHTHGSSGTDLSLGSRPGHCALFWDVQMAHTCQ